MKKIIELIIMIILLVSCAPSPEAIQKAIEQTQIAAPTPTSINLSTVDLVEFLIKPGDLPAGFTASQIREHGYRSEDLELNSINMVNQDVAMGDAFGGKISLYIYNSQESAEKAFNFLIGEFTEITPKEIVSLGDKAVGREIYVPLLMGLDPIRSSEVIFIRCKALVYATLETETAYSGLVDYAKRLDERIKTFVCETP